jgi:glycosyltransferase involved in cell wall biosynthesis
MRISIVIPCYGRPQRTRRIIDNLLSQTINGWEAFVIGDGCNHFQEMINSGEVDIFIKKAKENGNILHCHNLDKNYGGHGYFITNQAIKDAIGKYFVFAGNDDILLNNHFEHYLSEIENTDLDLVYYNTFVGPTNSMRIPYLQISQIGHSEIIVKTEILREFEHKPDYGHDWDLINFLVNKNIKYKKSSSKNYTYIVTHLPGKTIDFID